MVEVVLLLGGNIGDGSQIESRLDDAVAMIGDVEGVEIARRSTKHRTEPWGFDRGEDVSEFVNQAVVIKTELEPLALLKHTQRIEVEVGRERGQEREQREQSGERYASRVIDIDIIAFGDMVVDREELTIPHPLMQEREFVLRPMSEVSECWRHPVLDMNCKELIERLLVE